MIDAELICPDPGSRQGFVDVCLDVYDIVRSRGVISLHDIYCSFPEDMADRLDLVLKALRDDGCVSNASKGYVPEHPPSFLAITNLNDSSDPRRKCETRIEAIRALETRLLRILRDGGDYSPSDSVECAIDSMPPGTAKKILISYLMDGKSKDELEKVFGERARKAFHNLIDDRLTDPRDEKMFDTYNIPSNVMTYIMNRSASYVRLMNLEAKHGFVDICTALFSHEESELESPIHPSSMEMLDLRKRSKDAVHAYMSQYDNSLRGCFDFLLGLMNGVPHRINLIKDVACSLTGIESPRNVSEEEWSEMMDIFITTRSSIAFISSENIEGLRGFIDSMKETQYGITAEKMFNSHKASIQSFEIMEPDEFRQFIDKFTPYSLKDDRILVDGSWENSLRRYVANSKSRIPSSIATGYSRSCGGQTAEILKVLSGMAWMQQDDMNKKLTEEESKILRDKLTGYEWISRSNAQSLFHDMCELGEKFTDSNMLSLGYKASNDAFFKKNYENLKDCVLSTEFSGDDHYIGDSRLFKINLECKDYKRTIESLERTLEWIPVSSTRFINLKSEKYSQFNSILQTYRLRITTLCQRGFMTPTLLKNMNVGIPEIDDDDFSIEFYEAMLLSVRSNYRALEGQRFFFKPGPLSDYKCSVSDFVRYIAYNNGGSASMETMQSILKDKYGISANLPYLRAQAKNATEYTECIFNNSTDSIYIDEEAYREAREYGD